MVTKDMIIADVIRRHPQTIEVFRKFGLSCMECQIADLEQVEHGAGVHRADLEKLLEELNRVVREE